MNRMKKERFAQISQDQYYKDRTAHEHVHDEKLPSATRVDGEPSMIWFPSFVLTEFRK